MVKNMSSSLSIRLLFAFTLKDLSSIWRGGGLSRKESGGGEWGGRKFVSCSIVSSKPERLVSGPTVFLSESTPVWFFRCCVWFFWFGLFSCTRSVSFRLCILGPTSWIVINLAGKYCCLQWPQQRSNFEIVANRDLLSEINNGQIPQTTIIVHY